MLICRVQLRKHLECANASNVQQTGESLSSA